VRESKARAQKKEELSGKLNSHTFNVMTYVFTGENKADAIQLVHEMEMHSNDYTMNLSIYLDSN